MKLVTTLIPLLLSLFQSKLVESFALVSSGQRQVIGRQQLTSSSLSYSSATTTRLLPICPTQINRGQKSCRRSTRLFENLWDRLDIEADEEPQWYVLNCVAGLEMDLLRQCREACSDMPDVVKFVVPRHRQTRSHGANRMITEEKVIYLGYVFAKLRLCPEVYEAIRSLSLCRSWMGPVNQKGYRKLPPAPVALSDDEIVKFGLEAVETDEDEIAPVADNGSDVIFDSEENDEQEDSNKKFEEKALKVYLGLRVDDMVKVTAKGKFFNEDGIVRRLKEGKILVRFYTYGSMYDEWLEPGDVRKLSNIEILKGLSGPGQPITQNDFEEVGGGGRGNNEFRDGRGLRRDLMSNVKGAIGPRNRRQDREERGERFNKNDRFGTNNNFNNGDTYGRPPPRRDDQNWNYNQDRPRQARAEGPAGGRPQDNRFSNDNRRPNRYDSALSDEDSQWGRGPPRQQQPRGERRPFNDRGPNRPNSYNNNNNYDSQDNRRVAKAIDGNDDWSAFVAPAGGRQQQRTGPSGPSVSDEDQFFASLMSDLTDAVNSGKSDSGDNFKSGRRSEGKTPKSNDGDDFFASLMSEISSDPSGSSSSKTNRPKSREEKDSADDFFAALEAELGSAFDTSPAKVANKASVSSRASSTGGGDDSDDFFARLEAELSVPSPASSSPQEYAGSFQRNEEPSGSGKRTNIPNSEEGVIQEATVSENSSPPKRRKGSKAESSPSSKSDSEVGPAKQEKAPSPSSSSFAAKPNPAALDKCTVPVLKEMLRERGLKLTGKKSELIERLTQ